MEKKNRQSSETSFGILVVPFLERSIPDRLSEEMPDSSFRSMTNRRDMLYNYRRLLVAPLPFPLVCTSYFDSYTRT